MGFEIDPLFLERLVRFGLGLIIVVGIALAFLISHVEKEHKDG